jgi:ribonucleotide reductase alpha subunit
MANGHLEVLMMALFSQPARNLWIRLLTARVETGEPYVVYIDTVNRQIPQHHKLAGLKVKTSNLCSEITLPTGIDNDGKERTAVCCLSSLNLDTYDEWKDNDQFVEDVMRFLDNVMTDFINKAPDEFANAKYSAMRERSVGLGVMGLHSYFQQKGIPFGSVMSKVWNKKVFKNIQEKVDAASFILAEERGACPDAAEYGIKERFSNKTAIAPTASISIICGGTSAGVEPISGNSYTHKTLSGSFNVRNKYLQKVLEIYEKNNEEIWSSITTNQGSVSHLDFLSDAEEYGIKERFSNKTAIAPTASISIICGGSSPGIEPIAANSFTHKTLSGSFNVRNKYLKKILQKYEKDTDDVWSSITTNQGSVSHLDFLTAEEKDTFKTAFEIDQRWIIELGADRTPHISQAQSINVFVPADIHKKELHDIHFQAWKKGLKSLYYCRSKSIQRAENINKGTSTDVTKNVYSKDNESNNKDNNYEECLSCQ